MCVSRAARPRHAASHAVECRAYTRHERIVDDRASHVTYLHLSQPPPSERTVLISNLFESTARVPLLLSTVPAAARDPPGGLAAANQGQVVSRLVSLLDVFPTVLDLFSIPAPNALGLMGTSLLSPSRSSRRRGWHSRRSGHGTDRRDLDAGFRAQHNGSRSDDPTGGSSRGGGEGLSQDDDAIVSEYHAYSSNTGQFMLRTGRWKYIAAPGFRPMLFDLATDAAERHNVARLHPAVVHALDARLRRELDADYEDIDRQAKADDRESFAAWRGSFESEAAYLRALSQLEWGPGPKGFAAGLERNAMLIERWVRGGA